MKIFHLYIHVSLICVCTILPFSSQSQNIYQTQQRLEFADHLFQTQDYALAELEYAVLIDSSATQPDIAHMYVRSLCAQEKFMQARVFLETHNLYLSIDHLFAAYIQILLIQEQFDRADSLLHTNSLLSIAELNTLQLYSALLNNKKQEAIQQINLCIEQQIPIPKFLLTIPDYKVWKYALSSTLVPGLGKMLTNAPYDGMYALYSVGVSGFIAYRAYYIKGLASINGWTFGLVTAGMYGGNIYGTIKHVKKVPNSIINEIYTSIENDLIHIH